MATQEEVPAIPDPFDQSKFDALFLEVNMVAGRQLMQIRNGKIPNWFQQLPVDWVMLIMTLLKGLSRSILNYKEFRKGLLEVMTVCLLVVNYADQLNDEFSGKKNNN